MLLVQERAGLKGRGSISIARDSAHGHRETVEELHAWQPALAPGALVILDDFTHPDFPGVREAVEELGLSGRQQGTLFVHGAHG